MAETNALNDMVSLKPYPNVSAFLSGTKQAPTPKGYIGEPEIFPAQQELQQARAKAKEDIGKADINIEKAKREEQASKMQVDVDVEKESAERIKEMPERMALKAKQEEASALKFMPTKDTAQDIAGLFGLVGVISMALGGGGRMSGHLALGNMNAMMEGYRKGRTDLNKKEAVEFDKNFKSMQAALETLSREYKDALEIEKSDKERGRLERHMALAKSNSPVLKAMEERLGPVRVNDFLNELQTTMDKSVTLHNSLQKYADDRQAKKEAAQQAAQSKKESQKSSYEYVTKDGKTYAINKNNPKDIQEVNVDLGGATKVGAQPKGSSGAQAQFENITSADIGNAYFRMNEYLSKSKDGKIPEGSKFLRDKGTQLGVIDAYKNWMVNRSLPPDLQENDAALLGIAFDVVAARSFGRAAGVTDSKIAQVVRQLPVEGDSESTKQGKMRMLLNQLEEPNKLLPKEKRKDGSEYMVSPVSREIYTTYGGASSSEKKAMPTGEKLTAYTKAHPEFNDDEEKAKSYLRSQGYE